MEQRIYEMLGHQFCSGNNITLDTPCEVDQVDALALIVPARLDLIAKYLYVYNADKKLYSEFLNKLYDAHISAFTHGICAEPGNDAKNSLDDYHICFDELIDTIRNNGFDSDKSVVPVGEDNIILDGAHRVATCAYFHKKITVVRFKGPRLNFDYEYFKNEDLEATYFDTMALVYAILKENIFVANIWPIADDEKKLVKANAIIRSNTNVVLKKEIPLTYLGYRNYMLQIYSQHDWVGDFSNHFKGVTSKVDACYTERRKLTIYLFECDCLDRVLGLKDQIRDLFKIGNHSIHIS